MEELNEEEMKNEGGACKKKTLIVDYQDMSMLL